MLGLILSPVVVHAQRGDTSRVSDSARVIQAVTVTASAASARLIAVGFEDRRRTSGLPAAHFINRQAIEVANPSNLREMLSSLGARARSCASGTLFIDGVLTSGGNMELDGAPRRTRSNATTNSLSRSEQLDRISPKDVEGMEIYASSSQIPIIFRTSGMQNNPPSCVIVVWMRSS
ncbi:MAG: hypothetical protein ABI852_17025 [Gemmatimonadaceae bacterium]